MELHYPSNGCADEWQIFLWNLPDQLLARPQKLEFMLMLEANFNAFNPYQVVADLLDHRDLWTGAVMERGYVFPEPSRPGWAILRGDLIHLRDVGDGHWNVDTLYIHTAANSDAQWQQIVANWKADEVNFYEGELAGSLLGVFATNDPRKILRVWWD
jgi:hypothetical protein